MTDRYTWQPQAAQRRGVHEYRITDTTTDSRVATCYLRENADMIVAALNEQAARAAPVQDDPMKLPDNWTEAEKACFRDGVKVGEFRASLRAAPAQPFPPENTYDPPRPQDANYRPAQPAPSVVLDHRGGGRQEPAQPEAYAKVDESQPILHTQTAQPAGERDIHDAFYRLTVQQRDAAWREAEELRTLLLDIRQHGGSIQQYVKQIDAVLGKLPPAADTPPKEG